jgi:hypothetical protein
VGEENKMNENKEPKQKSDKKPCCIGFGIVIILLLFIYVRLFIWTSRFYIVLPNDYHIFNTDFGAILELDASKESARMDRYPNFDDYRRIRLGPGVDGYKVFSKIIVGHVTIRSNYKSIEIQIPKSENAGTEPISGYFIIDTTKNEFYDGLSKDSWKRKLFKFGIKKEPVIHAPSSLDKYLGYNRP